MGQRDARERRNYVRFTVQLHASLTSAYATEDATVSNLSADGCRLKSHLAPREGTELAIHLHVVDDGSTIRIDRAVVRWSAGPDFGVQFLLMGVHEADQLQRIVKQLTPGDS